MIIEVFYLKEKAPGFINAYFGIFFVYAVPDFCMLVLTGSAWGMLCNLENAMAATHGKRAKGSHEYDLRSSSG
ncbi:hypothetical protein [Gluconobacter oxydans]|uniref:hypothetical protein n=1 Tax=Gluconobacter oxydans TaxID=442 RepID=UPI0039E89A02